MAFYIPRRLRDLLDVQSTFDDGQVPTWDAALGKFKGASGGSLPSQLTFIDAAPYMATGVRDYAALFPADGYDHPGYALFAGVVRFTGVAETTQQSTAALFTALPAAIRPRAKRRVIVHTGSGFAGYDVQTDGTITKPGGGFANSFATLDFTYPL